MQKSAMAFFVVGILILTNVLSVGVFTRCDLTHNKAFTLSDTTRNMLENLDTPVKVTAYFTEDLPPPFSDNARYVRDLLDEYRAASHGNLSFEFVDPQSQETDADKEKKKDVKRDIFGRQVREKTSVESELEGLGIGPVEVRVFEQDQQQTKRAYMGIAIRFGEEKEAIPVVQDTSTLEYDLTSLIRRLTRSKQPTVGFVQGHGEPTLQELDKLQQLLSQNYTTKEVTLTGEGGVAVPDDVDVLLVIGPKQPYSPDEIAALDAFEMKGKAIGFFLDRNDVDLKTFQPTAVESNLDELVSSYGIELGSRLVGDVECASLSVQQRRGPMVINMPLKYPFIPQPRTLAWDSPMTKGLGDITIPFSVPVYPKTVDGVEIVPLAKSSQKSWLEDATADGLSPQRDWQNADVSFTGPYTLIAQARGKLPSHADASKKSEADARVIVAGTSALLSPEIMGPPNAALALNMVDWLSLDSGLLDMRSRSLNEAPFDPNLPDGTRDMLKFGNLLGAPLLLLVFGLVRWRMRESRRKALAVSTPA